MRVKDIVEHLQSLDQEAEVLVASYYYDAREGFVQIWKDEFEKMIIRPSASRYNQHYEGNCYLFDTQTQGRM